MTEKDSRYQARSFARMIALQILYRTEANPAEELADDEFIRSELSAVGHRAAPTDSLYTETPAVNVEDAPQRPFSESELAELFDFTRSLLDAAAENRTAIDEKIRGAAQNWTLSRMAATDRNILRLAVAEIDFLKTPTAVAINEAIELAKKFGEADSGSFVNGVLGKIVK